MSISNKSVSRINKAVKEQTSNEQQKDLAAPKIIKAAISSQKSSAISRITQNLPDYLL